jgi:hypothetical protein
MVKKQTLTVHGGYILKKKNMWTVKAWYVKLRPYGKSGVRVTKSMKHSTWINKHENISVVVYWDELVSLAECC